MSIDPTGLVRRDGYVRRVFADVVSYTPEFAYDAEDVEEWSYDVARYPFVPGYHVVQYEHGAIHEVPDTTILSTHKTLAEAISICKILLANGGIKYE